MSAIRWVSIALVAALAACSDDDERSSTREKAIDQYDVARAQWEATGIDSYRYTYGYSCFCAPTTEEAAGPGEYVVTVRNGVIESAVQKSDGATLNPQQLESMKTVDELFDVLDEALIDDQADSVEVSYDEALGYPTDVAIDYYLAAADDEIWYSGRELVELD